ncbi:MAG: class I SAM-dependent methyltransferase [Gammaproteobacteria bacterium]|nr:class I SAM-dependent methyltransferase [Gammaproteobacteria bacterium]MCB1904375.1 class I SAM-dependent methyltransferase [Gammaproteobacteria bacterium]
MPEPVNRSQGHFQQGGAAYAQSRPTYPPELAQLLAGYCVGKQLAVDVGCGTGQLSVLLADHFDRVIATDVSADQLAHAQPRPNVVYQCESAERMSAGDGAADLIVAAQAAHWFNLPRFYRECGRVGRPGAVIALVSYGVPYLEGPLNARFQQFYWQQTTRFWPAGRQHVETGYAELPFPFATLPTPGLFIHRDWQLDQLLDYIKTWSACRAARDGGDGEIFDGFFDELIKFWGERCSNQRITWPIAMRLGRL